MKKIILTILVILTGACPVQAGVWWVDGHLEINEGDVYDGELFITGHGSVDMFGGVVGKLETWDYSKGNIYGGEIDWLFTEDNTVVNIKGGKINTLGCFPNSKVYLYAYDVKLHPPDNYHNDPWLDGKYLSDNSSFSFEFYDEDCIPQLNVVSELVNASMDIQPNVLNLSSKGKWINCEIRFGEDCNAVDVNSATIFLEDEIPAQWVWFNETQNVVMAKFARSDLEAVLEPGNVELTVSGFLNDGRYFIGTDAIKVIDKGRKKD